MNKVNLKYFSSDFTDELQHMVDRWHEEYDGSASYWLEQQDDESLTENDYYKLDKVYTEIETLIKKNELDLSREAIDEIVSEILYLEDNYSCYGDFKGSDLKKDFNAFMVLVGERKPRAKRTAKRGSFNKDVLPIWKEIISEVGEPLVNLVSQSAWRRIVGKPLGRFYGKVSYTHHCITCAYNRSQEEIRTTLWHELGHYLFRSKPHWWIEAYAAVMSGTQKMGRYSTRYKKTIDDLPSREELLRLSRLSTNRKNAA